MLKAKRLKELKLEDDHLPQGSHVPEETRAPEDRQVDEGSHVPEDSHVDEGGKNLNKPKVRSCALTRTVRPRSELIRFVAGPDGQIVADFKAILPGRGVWLSAHKKTIDLALERNLFSRALKCKVNAPADLGTEVGHLLKQRTLAVLGLALKAGQVILGQMKVEKALMSEPIIALLFAKDGAEDSLRKLIQASNRASEGDDNIPIFTQFTADELSQVFGRENAVQAALLRPPKRPKNDEKGFLQTLRKFEQFYADEFSN